MARRLILMCALVALGTAEFAEGAVATSLRALPNLESIRFTERTTVLFVHNFDVEDAALKTRIVDLGETANDFTGTEIEFYDVFYSDEDGNPDEDGFFLSVEAIYAPGLGGLNIADVSLIFENAFEQTAEAVASFHQAGVGALPTSIGRAFDGNVNTHTSMGTSSDQANRLRLTFDFGVEAPAQPIPEPSVIGIVGLSGLALVRRRHAV